MPGLLGIVSPTRAVDTAGAFARMLEPMARGGRLQVEQLVSPDGAIAVGRVHLGVLQPRRTLGSWRPVLALFHGDLHNRSELRAASGCSPEATDAEIVEAVYRQHGLNVAAQLKGSFCLAIVDSEAKRTVLVADRLASYPLYWCRIQDGFAFASEVRGLTRVQERPKIDPLALNDLLQFGFPTGDRTLAAGVALVPGATTVSWDWHQQTVAVDRYHQWQGAYNKTTSDKAAFLDRVTAAFEAAMSRAQEGDHRYGLSLSGGMDTRVLLSALDRRGTPLQTFTLGGRGCADEVIGEQLARLAKTRHQFMPLEESYLADLLPMTAQMTSLSDGMYTTDGFTELLALRSFEQTDVSVILRGHLGELAKAGTAYPFHTDGAVFEMTETSQLVSHLLARQESLNAGSRSAGLFTEAWSAAEDPSVARATLERAADVDLKPADLCSYLYLTEYHRRVTVPSLEIFRNAAEVRLPLADEEFVTFVLGGDARWRNSTEIHQTLVRRINPKFLRIRNPNTGAPAGAGPLQEYVLDKLNSVLRRLNVYGYRHYHAFDGWMRNAFLAFLDDVLLGPQSLDRGILHQAPLAQLVAAAKQGDHSADHVLQVLVVAELWQRENFG